MKLYYTQNSPYAHRVRIVAREAGLMGEIEEIDASARDTAATPLAAHGPGGKVPSLLTDDGILLRETLLLTRYLDDLSGGRLTPADPHARRAALALEGLGSLLMESVFTRSRESRREAALRSQAALDKEAARTRTCYDALEAVAGEQGDAVNLGTIAVVAALGYADWRTPEDAWRDGRPKLEAWYERSMRRPAFAETKLVT